MSEYNCVFERIGRNHDVPPLYVQADDADEIAYSVYTYARKYLASSGFEVVVDLAKMSGSINYGRFGSFAVVPV